MKRLSMVLVLSLFAPVAFAQNPNSIPEDSRIYLAPMGGFETNLMAALNRKKVPLVIVGSRSTADFEVAPAELKVKRLIGCGYGCQAHGVQTRKPALS